MLTSGAQIKKDLKEGLSSCISEVFCVRNVPDSTMDSQELKHYRVNFNLEIPPKRSTNR